MSRLPQKKAIKDDPAASTTASGSIWDGVVNRYNYIATRATTFYNRVQPYVSWTADTTWAVASTAVLLALPIVVEIQRETTVMVAQRQREREMQDVQEQIRMTSGSIVDQMSGMAKMLTGGAPGQ